MTTFEDPQPLTRRAARERERQQARLTGEHFLGFTEQEVAVPGVASDAEGVHEQPPAVEPASRRASHAAHAAEPTQPAESRRPAESRSEPSAPSAFDSAYPWAAPTAAPPPAPVSNESWAPPAAAAPAAAAPSNDPAQRTLTRREARLLQQQAEAALAGTPPLVEPEAPPTSPNALSEALRFAPPPTQAPADYHPAPEPVEAPPAPDLAVPLGARWGARVDQAIATPVEEAHGPSAESVDESFAALFGATGSGFASPSPSAWTSAGPVVVAPSLAGAEPESGLPVGPAPEAETGDEAEFVVEVEPPVTAEAEFVVEPEAHAGSEPRAGSEVAVDVVDAVIDAPAPADSALDTRADDEPDTSVASAWPFAFGRATPEAVPGAEAVPEAEAVHEAEAMREAEAVRQAEHTAAPEPERRPAATVVPEPDEASVVPIVEAGAASDDASFVQPSVARTSYTPPASHWSRMGEDDGGGGLPVDTTLSRQVGGSNVTTTSAIILPSVPQADFASIVNGTGEILITGTIQLPEGLGSLGGDARNLDHPDVDRLLDSLDAELVSNDSAPVRAIRAVSTHTATNAMIVPPQKPKGSRWLTAGIIAVGVLVVAVVGLLAVYVIKM
ncbi:hypothetical protein QT381_01630 [Galbitalea sp. SE-J8]|uniref:hypothetical protein n=1 Tax=Galbitalea sp. SE-J8 TaxID=3054952 RepID=UPI00259C7E92|nr:hypothetical protein [Galbitalea sp. SE-J8]MDM4761705.1 hypothetical protein [Galbitalea sp. SE-J8]